MLFLRNIFLSLALLMAPFVVNADDQININTADAATLATIDGVGDAKAAEIISYREQNGPFKSIDDLLNVKGIGESILDQNRDKLTVGDEGASKSMQ
jgi:competence protein ComEA